MCRIGSTFWSVRVSSGHSARVRGTNHLDPAISALVSGDSVNIKRGRGTCLKILIRSGIWFGLWDAAAVLYPSTFPNSQDSKFSPVTSRVDGWARRGCGRDRDSVFRYNLQSHLRCSTQSQGYSANQRCRLSRQSSPTFTPLTRTIIRVDHGK
jgi:hypothetical protein